MPPTFAQGKICYIEVPVTDIARRSFRAGVDGSTAFDDGEGEVSGTWVLGRPPASIPGLLPPTLRINAEKNPSLLRHFDSNGVSRSERCSNPFRYFFRISSPKTCLES